jgi:hypothetical protein
MDGMVHRLMPIEAQNNGDLGEVNFEEMKKADEFQFEERRRPPDDEYKGSLSAPVVSVFVWHKNI